MQSKIPAPKEAKNPTPLTAEQAEKVKKHIENMELVFGEGDPNLLLETIKAGVPVDTANREGVTALMLCSAEVAKTLVETYKANVNLLNSNGGTALHVAARSKRADKAVKVAYLLGQKANINAKDNEGETALHHAINSRNSIDTVRVLIEHGANLEAFDRAKKTPLQLAVSQLDLGAADLLIKGGASISAMDGPFNMLDQLKNAGHYLKHHPEKQEAFDQLEKYLKEKGLREFDGDVVVSDINSEDKMAGGFSGAVAKRRHSDPKLPIMPKPDLAVQMAEMQDALIKTKGDGHNLEQYKHIIGQLYSAFKALNLVGKGADEAKAIGGRGA